jgi:hypothetical protein
LASLNGRRRLLYGNRLQAGDFFVLLEHKPSERQFIQRTLKLLVYEAMAN